MEHVNCERIREWAHHVVQKKVFQPFEDAAFYRHVATCDTCRGALIALSLIEPELLPPYSTIACTDCRADLAAFVDAAELAPGSEVALYPALWWHLLSCQDCADEYADLRAFASAMPHDSVGAPLLAPAQPRQARSGAWIARLALPRDFLRVALPSIHPQRWGVQRGGHTQAHLLMQETVAPGFQATVSVRQDTAEQWSIVVTIVPPLAAQVKLTLGDLVQYAVLDAQGSAIIGPVPSDVLLAADGPGIEIAIQRDAAP